MLLNFLILKIIKPKLNLCLFNLDSYIIKEWKQVQY